MLRLLISGAGITGLDSREKLSCAANIRPSPFSSLLTFCGKVVWMAASENSSAAGRIAFTYPNFVLFQLARVFIVLSGEMQSVAVGWEVYEITKQPLALGLDRKSTRLNSSHTVISYAVFCLKKKKK